MNEMKAEEGSVFLVPLQPAGFAVGVLARSDSEGRSFGYFFGPRLTDVSAVDFEQLVPEKAVLVCKFGDYGLFHGKWQVVGAIPNWTSVRWPLPRFTRKHDQSDRCYLVEYDDALNAISENVVPRDSAMLGGLPYDSQLGSEIVEVRLGKLLSSRH